MPQCPRRLSPSAWLALPITVGTAKFPGIKIHDTRMIRLMEVLLDVHLAMILFPFKLEQRSERNLDEASTPALVRNVSSRVKKVRQCEGSSCDSTQYVHAF